MIVANVNWLCTAFEPLQRCWLNCSISIIDLEVLIWPACHSCTKIAPMLCGKCKRITSPASRILSEFTCTPRPVQYQKAELNFQNNVVLVALYHWKLSTCISIVLSQVLYIYSNFLKFAPFSHIWHVVQL